MNTPESDMEQMKFAREWVRKKAKKRMEKLEKKLGAEAKKYFGHPVSIQYLHPDEYMRMWTSRPDCRCRIEPIDRRNDGGSEN